jgi:hypothetical protein
MAFDIAYILNQWAAYGMFDYVLPFLLIFATVFGILVTVNIFKDQKAVDAIIAVSIALLALQFGKVPLFFSHVFPNMGVALAVILVVIILAGFFIDPGRSWIMYTLLGIGAIAAIATLVTTTDDLGWMSSAFIKDNIPGFVAALAIIIIIAIIVGGTSTAKHEPYKLRPLRE